MDEKFRQKYFNPHSDENDTPLDILKRRRDIKSDKTNPNIKKLRGELRHVKQKVSSLQKQVRRIEAQLNRI